MLGPRLPGQPGPLQCVRDALQSDQVGRRPVLAALAAAVPSVSPQRYAVEARLVYPQSAEPTIPPHPQQP